MAQLATLSRAGYSVGDASTATQYKRWNYASSVPGKTGVGFKPFSLASVSRLVEQQLAPPVPTCVIVVVYNGGSVDNNTFSDTYNGNGVVLSQFILFDGGIPSTNFC